MTTRTASDSSSDAEAPTVDVLAKAGALEARLARTPQELEAAQRLRYEVFYREMGAKPTPEMEAQGRDFDRYDAFCDHLLVFDSSDGTEVVVGCYRLLRGEVAARNGGFYSAAEYDLSRLLEASPPDTRFIELGRSCVAKNYRSSQVMQFMWRGLMHYLLTYKIDLMFGCASLPGTDPTALKEELSYLHHYCAVPPELPPVRAVPARYIGMNLLPADRIHPQHALLELPPLLKGYIRAGCYIGDGAVIDDQFNTTDVFIYFPTSRLDPRLLKFLTRARPENGGTKS